MASDLQERNRIFRLRFGTRMRERSHLLLRRGNDMAYLENDRNKDEFENPDKPVLNTGRSQAMYTTGAEEQLEESEIQSAHHVVDTRCSLD